MWRSSGRFSVKPAERISSSWMPMSETMVWPCGTGGGEVLWRCRTRRPTSAADRQSDLPVQSVLDVRAAVLRAPAEPNDVVQAEIEIAIEGNRGSRIRGVVGFVGSGRQVHGTGEAPQPSRFPTRLGRPQVPYDRAGSRVENPGGRWPGGLVVVLPMLLIALAQPIGPGLGADGRDLHVLWRCQHEGVGLVLTKREITDIDENGGGALGLGQQQHQHERHG